MADDKRGLTFYPTTYEGALRILPLHRIPCAAEAKAFLIGLLGQGLERVFCCRKPFVKLSDHRSAYGSGTMIRFSVFRDRVHVAPSCGCCSASH
jgi:hypothetical protein